MVCRWCRKFTALSTTVDPLATPRFELWALSMDRPYAGTAEVSVVRIYFSLAPEYTECKKYTLQGLVASRWAPCDHILLINLCSKTLRLRASVSEISRRT